MCLCATTTYIFVCFPQCVLPQEGQSWDSSHATLIWTCLVAAGKKTTATRCSRCAPHHIMLVGGRMTENSFLPLTWGFISRPNPPPWPASPIPTIQPFYFFSQHSGNKNKSVNWTELLVSMNNTVWGMRSSKTRIFTIFAPLSNLKECQCQLYFHSTFKATKEEKEKDVPDDFKCSGKGGDLIWSGKLFFYHRLGAATSNPF